MNNTLQDSLPAPASTAAELEERYAPEEQVTA